MNHTIYPTTNFKAIEQLTVERGEGCYVWDNKGNRYIEGLAGLWCTALGYGNQEVIQAAAEQMGKLSFSPGSGGQSIIRLPAQAQCVGRRETRDGSRTRTCVFCQTPKALCHHVVR